MAGMKLKRRTIYVDPEIDELVQDLSEIAGDSSITRTYHHLIELGLQEEVTARSGAEIVAKKPGGEEVPLVPPGGSLRRRPKIEPNLIKDGKG